MLSQVPEGTDNWHRTWCSAWFTPVVVKPDETPGKISEFNEAVGPRSSLRRSFSVQEAIVNSVYLSIPSPRCPPPPAIAERKTFC